MTITSSKMAEQRFIGGAFARNTLQYLQKDCLYPWEKAVDTTLSIFPVFSKGNLVGLTMEILGIVTSNQHEGVYRGMPLEKYLEWVDRNHEGFRVDWGGELQKAFAAGTNTAAANLDEAAKTELELDSVSYRGGIAAFYHAIALEDHEQIESHTPLQIASWRVENFYEEIFNDYQAGLTDTAVRAFWQYFGFEMTPEYHPKVWW